MKKAIIIAMFGFMNLVFSQNSGVFRYITFENSSFLSDGRLKENGFTYATAINGEPLFPLLSSDSYNGKNSLLLQTLAASITQRFEYKLSDYNEPDALRFNNDRFVGFAIKIPDNFDPLEGSILFFQAWQGSPWGPPIMLKFTSGSNPYVVRLTIRNSNTGPDSVNPDEKIWEDRMYKNLWYTFVIHMLPRLEGDSSQIQLWMNGEKKLDWRNKGNIGYNPDIFSVDKPFVALCLKFGIYQTGANSKHSLLFDEIKLASNYQDAIPGNTFTSLKVSVKEIPFLPKLEQNYPNPFNASTQIRFEIDKPGFVSLIVFNSLGQKVETLMKNYLNSGSYEIAFNASHLHSGVYFYRLDFNGLSKTKEMLLLK